MKLQCIITVFPKVFLLLQDIWAGNRKHFTRPNQLFPDRKKLTVKDTLYKMLIILCLQVVYDQLIPVILSADKTMKRQRMILFPRASSKTFNQIFISVYMYFDYWSLAYLCFFFYTSTLPLFFLPFEILL